MSCFSLYKMHSYAYVVKTFAGVIKERVKDVASSSVLTSLWQLFAVNGILNRLGDFLSVSDMFLDYCNSSLTSQVSDCSYTYAGFY